MEAEEGRGGGSEVFFFSPDCINASMEAGLKHLLRPSEIIICSVPPCSV